MTNHRKVFISFRNIDATVDLEESYFNEAVRAENKLQCLWNQVEKGKTKYRNLFRSLVWEERRRVGGEGHVMKIGYNKSMIHNKKKQEQF